MTPLKIMRDYHSFEYNLCDSLCLNYVGVWGVWAKFHRLSTNMIILHDIKQYLENKIEND